MTLDHLVRRPAAPGGRPPLLVLLHGIGADEEDLFGLAGHLDGRFLVVSARAPFEAEPMGYAWYAIDWSAFPPRADAAQALESRDRLERFLGEAVAAYGADPAGVHLLGFSEGASMALGLALSRPDLVRSVVAHSGRLLRQLVPAAPPSGLAGLPVLLQHRTGRRTGRAVRRGYRPAAPDRPALRAPVQPAVRGGTPVVTGRDGPHLAARGGTHASTAGRDRGTPASALVFPGTRGRVSAVLSTQAQAFDLIVLGKRTGISVMTLTQASVAGADPNAGAGPVLVLFEDRPTSSRSLETGATLARRNGADLVLLIHADSEEAYRSACAEALAALDSCGTAGRCSRLGALDGASLVRAARREGAGCLVLANKERFLTQAGFERMLDEIECPIVLIR